jgi:DNA-binding transcriptional ArsR family regulator
LIDRIRQEIQERLEQILAEADKLRAALVALGDRAKTQTSTPAPAPRKRTRSSTPAASSKPATATRAAAKPAAAPKATNSSTRTAPGATKNTVLAALEKGGALTAGEVAEATGLGRGTVSTTLSKLARAGVVVKAERGYRLPNGANGGEAPASGTNGEAAGSD